MRSFSSTGPSPFRIARQPYIDATDSVKRGLTLPATAVHHVAERLSWPGVPGGRLIVGVLVTQSDHAYGRPLSRDTEGGAECPIPVALHPEEQPPKPLVHRRQQDEHGGKGRIDQPVRNRPP